MSCAIGAIAGAFAAAIVPLGSCLCDLATSAGDAEEDMRSFAEAMEDAEEGVDQARRNMPRSARENMERIREEYGRVTAEAMRFARIGDEIDLQKAVKDAKAAGTKVLDEGVFAGLDALAERLADIDTRIENVEARIGTAVGPALQALRAQLTGLQPERFRLEADVGFDPEISPETFERFVELRNTIEEAPAPDATSPTTPAFWTWAATRRCPPPRRHRPLPAPAAAGSTPPRARPSASGCA